MKILESKIIKSVKWLLILSFIIVYIGRDYAYAIQYLNAERQMLRQISVPFGYGQIVEDFSGVGENPRVILIQDLHANYGVQENIKEILKYLNSNYKLEKIGLEGDSSGSSVDTSLISAIPDENIKRKTVEYFMRKSLLRGAEAFSCMEESSPELVGIEDRELYEKDRNLLLSSLNKRAESVEYLEKITYLLNELKKEIYSRDLMEFTSQVSLYRQKKISEYTFQKYLRQWAERAGLPLGCVSAAYAGYLAANLKRYEIDEKKVQLEYENLLKEVNSEKGDNSLLNAVKEFQNLFKAPENVQKKIAELISGSAKYENLRNYLETVNRFKEINTYKLLEEEDKVINAVSQSLCRDNEDRSLLFVSNYMLLTVKFLLNQITRKELDGYIAQAGEFENNFDLLRKSAGSKMEAIDGLLYKLNPYLEEMASFYSLARKRDESFIRNFVEKEKDIKGNIAMITGGFHLEGVAGKLKELNIPYTVILPRVVSHSEEEVRRYYGILRDEYSLSYEELIAERLGFASRLFKADFLNKVVFKAAALTVRKLENEYKRIGRAGEKINSYISKGLNKITGRWSRNFQKKKSRNYYFSIKPLNRLKGLVFLFDLNGESRILSWIDGKFDIADSEVLREARLFEAESRIKTALRNPDFRSVMENDIEAAAVITGFKPLTEVKDGILFNFLSECYSKDRLAGLKSRLEGINPDLRIVKAENRYLIYDRDGVRKTVNKLNADDKIDESEKIDFEEFEQNPGILEQWHLDILKGLDIENVLRAKEGTAEIEIVSPAAGQKTAFAPEGIPGYAGDWKEENLHTVKELRSLIEKHKNIKQINTGRIYKLVKKAVIAGVIGAAAYLLCNYLKINFDFEFLYIFSPLVFSGLTAGGKQETEDNFRTALTEWFNAEKHKIFTYFTASVISLSALAPALPVKASVSFAAANQIIKLLHNPEATEEKRKEAIRRLGRKAYLRKKDKEKAVEVLIEYLGDKTLGTYAAMSLGRLGAIDELLSVVNDSQASYTARSNAINELSFSKYENEVAIEKIKKAFIELLEDESIGRNAAYGLVRLKAVDDLIEVINNTDNPEIKRKNAVRGLAGIEEEYRQKVKDLLIALLNDNVLGKDAAYVLGFLDFSEELLDIIKLPSTADKARLNAFYALGLVGYEDKSEKEIKAVKEAALSCLSDGYAGWQAAEVLSKLKAKTELAEVLKNPDLGEEERISAIVGLLNMGAVDVLERNEDIVFKILTKADKIDYFDRKQYLNTYFSKAEEISGMNDFLALLSRIREIRNGYLNINNIKKIYGNRRFIETANGWSAADKLSLAREIEIFLSRFNREITDENIDLVLPHILAIEKSCAERPVISEHSRAVLGFHDEMKDRQADLAGYLNGFNNTVQIVKNEDIHIGEAGKEELLKKIANPDYNLVWLNGHGGRGKFWLSTEKGIDYTEIARALKTRFERSGDLSDLTIIMDMCHSTDISVRVVSELERQLEKQNIPGDKRPLIISSAHLDAIGFGRKLYQGMKENTPDEGPLRIKHLYKARESAWAWQQLSILLPISEENWKKIEDIFAAEAKKVKQEEDRLVMPPDVQYLIVQDKTGKSDEGSANILGKYYNRAKGSWFSFIAAPIWEEGVFRYFTFYFLQPVIGSSVWFISAPLFGFSHILSSWFARAKDRGKIVPSFADDVRPFLKKDIKEFAYLASAGFLLSAVFLLTAALAGPLAGYLAAAGFHSLHNIFTGSFGNILFGAAAELNILGTKIPEKDFEETLRERLMRKGYRGFQPFGGASGLFTMLHCEIDGKGWIAKVLPSNGAENDRKTVEENLRQLELAKKLGKYAAETYILEDADVFINGETKRYPMVIVQEEVLPVAEYYFSEEKDQREFDEKVKGRLIELFKHMWGQGIVDGDVNWRENYGFTADGRLVIFDFDGNLETDLKWFPDPEDNVFYRFKTESVEKDFREFCRDSLRKFWRREESAVKEEFKERAEAEVIVKPGFYHGTDSSAFFEILKTGQIFSRNEMGRRGLELKTGIAKITGEENADDSSIYFTKTWENARQYAEFLSGNSDDENTFPVILGVKQDAPLKEISSGSDMAAVEDKLNIGQISSVFVPEERVKETKKAVKEVSGKGTLIKVFGLESYDETKTARLKVYEDMTEVEEESPGKETAEESARQGIITGEGPAIITEKVEAAEKPLALYTVSGGIEEKHIVPGSGEKRLIVTGVMSDGRKWIIEPASSDDIEQIKNLWKDYKFSWPKILSKPRSLTYKFCTVLPGGQKRIEGLVTYNVERDHLFLDRIENAPWNRGEKREIKGVGTKLLEVLLGTSILYDKSKIRWDAQTPGGRIFSEKSGAKQISETEFEFDLNEKTDFPGPGKSLIMSEARKYKERKTASALHAGVMADIISMLAGALPGAEVFEVLGAGMAAEEKQYFTAGYIP